MVTEKISDTAARLSEDGKTPLFFAKNGELLGIIAVADVIKDDSPQAVKELQDMGIHVVMLTGDNERTANAIGRQAGVDEVIAGVLPDGKDSVIRKLKKKGRTAMVGDGINDAPALATADTGIAMGDCADITGETADIVLSAEDGLSGLYKTRVLGSLLMDKIDSNNRNIVAVNTSLMFLGLFGFISPSLAALLHNASTIAFSVKSMQPLLGED